MMRRFFELLPDEGFDFVLGEGDGYKIFRLFRDHFGRDLRHLWLPFRVDIISMNQGKRLKRGDFLIGLWGSSVIFRSSAHEKIGQILKQEGEIFEFSSRNGEPLFLLIPSVCDCLSPSGNQPLVGATDELPNPRHSLYIFDRRICAARRVFMVPHLKPRTFFSEEMVEEINGFELTGARFDYVARSEGV